MGTKTPAELIRYMVQHADAAPENAELAEPGTEGHSKPWEPWNAPVMLLAGSAPNGLPWLYLACRCGWWLGYSPQYDPIELAKVAVVHGENCKLKPDPEPVADVPVACPVCRDTGMVQCAEQDGSGMYEQACPEPVHDGQPCPACGGKGYTESPGCTCGVGPSGYYGMHERYCGVEPCPRGCAFVAPGTRQEAPF